MTSTTTDPGGELRFALDEILVRDNVRDLDDAHVAETCQSLCECQGLPAGAASRLDGLLLNDRPDVG
jgi:hypothetical protein